MFSSFQGLMLAPNAKFHTKVSTLAALWCTTRSARSVAVRRAGSWLLQASTGSSQYLLADGCYEVRERCNPEVSETWYGTRSTTRPSVLIHTRALSKINKNTFLEHYPHILMETDGQTRKPRLRGGGLLKKPCERVHTLEINVTLNNIQP